MGCLCVGIREKYTTPEANITEGQPLPHFPAAEPIRTLRSSLTSAYRLKKIIRRSDGGSLYHAEFRGTHQVCFLKAIPKLAERKNQSSVLRFEAERLRRLDHPHILRTFDVMQDCSHCYYVSEPFLGGQVSACLERFAQENTLARAMQQVFSALNYCHQQGIVHKRLSLESLVLTAQRSDVKLTNFGVLDSVLYSSSKIDPAHFCAPETGKNEKCDIWSCGVLMYVLLARQSPFASTTIPLAQQKSRKKNVTFAPEVWDERSAEVVSLIVSMLDINPQARPSAAQCLAHPWIRLNMPASALTAISIDKCVRSLRLVHRRNPLKDSVLKFVLQRVISDKRTRRFSEVFQILDSHGDGVLLEEELSRALSRCFDESTGAAKKVLKTCQDSACLTYSEFLISCYGEKRLLSAVYLRAAFACFEREGTVRFQDLYEYFCVKKAAEADWADLRALAGSEALEFQQFARAVTLS